MLDRTSGEAQAGGVSVAVRHIESMIRMSEASARMHLRDHVRDEDVDVAISTLLHSVIESQKFSVAQSMRKKFAQYLTHKKDAHELLLFELRRAFGQAASLHAMRHDPSDAAAAVVHAMVRLQKWTARGDGASWRSRPPISRFSPR